MDYNSNPKSVASKILHSLGDHFFDKGTEKTMTVRTHLLLKECGVEMIVFEEFQHLIDSDTHKVIRKAADWVKTFSNEVKIPIILCGLPELEKIFVSNEQLDGRFPIRKTIPLYKYRDNEDKFMFKTFLKNVDLALPFANQSHLANNEISSKIFYSSLGNTRQIMNLLEKATELVTSHGQDSISEEYLYLAFNEINNSQRPHIINPFNDKFNYSEYIDIEIRAKKKKGNPN